MAAPGYAVLGAEEDATEAVPELEQEQEGPHELPEGAPHDSRERPAGGRIRMRAEGAACLIHGRKDASYTSRMSRKKVNTSCGVMKVVTGPRPAHSA